MSRTTLKPIVSKLREAIIKGVAGKLEKYGFDENGKLVVEKPLSEYDETVKKNLIALFDIKEISNQDKYVEYIHDTSRTFMHILICFKLMEKRGIMNSLLQRLINTDIYNEIIPDFVNVDPMAFDEFGQFYLNEIELLSKKDNEEEDILYYQTVFLIQSLSHVMAEDVPLLFKDYEYIMIQPEFEDLKVILADMSSIEEEEYYEDDFLGWVYQYWVDTSKEEVLCALEEKKLTYANSIYHRIVSHLSEEQSEFGEFYTPRHVVKDIVDTSIAKYLSENHELKSIKILDPACGAGNFLVYAFGKMVQLLNTYYPNMTLAERIESVLSNNIFGADIQREPLQITAINLWIKAKYMAEEANVKILNLYNINVLMANSLYPWEEEEEFHQMSFFEEEQEPQFSYENIGRMISSKNIENHNNAISFYKQRFSIVVMNPPYLGIRKMKEETANFLKLHYPKNYFNLFEAFIVRAYNLLANDGVCGFVGTDTFMNLDSYENLRLLLLNKTKLLKIEQIGNVFDGPTVNAVVMIWIKNRDNKDNEVLCLSNTSQFKYESYISQSQFKVIKGCPIIPTLTDHIASIFKKRKTLVEYAEIKQGMISGNNKKYLRYKWEIPQSLIGKRFFPYANGGGYSKYANDIMEYIDYEDDGRILKEDAKRKYGSASRTIKNVAYFFRQGITYSPIGGNGFSARKLPNNCIFSDKGPCIFPKNMDEEYLLGFANSKVFNYLIKLLNPTIGFAISDIERVPFVEPTAKQKQQVIELCKMILNRKERILGFDKKSDFYHETELQFGFNKGATTIKEAYKIYEKEFNKISNEVDTLQKQIDECFYTMYGITEDERKVIEENISGNIISESEKCSIERACINYLREIAYVQMSNDNAKIFTLEEVECIILKSLEESNGYLLVEEIESILSKKVLDIVRVGAKVEGSNKRFAGMSTKDLNEPLIISKNLAGTGKNQQNIYWIGTEFLIEYEEDKKYAMQNEIRRLTNDVYLPKLQRAKEKLQLETISASEKKALDKEVDLYQECVKTLENWKVVD